MDKKQAEILQHPFLKSHLCYYIFILKIHRQEISEPLSIRFRTEARFSAGFCDSFWEDEVTAWHMRLSAKN